VKRAQVLSINFLSFLFFFVIFLAILYVRVAELKINIENFKDYYIYLTKYNYLKDLTNFGGYSSVKGDEEFYIPQNLSEEYIGLAIVNAYGVTIPYSIDIRKFKLLKDFLEQCEAKYHVSSKSIEATKIDSTTYKTDYEKGLCYKYYYINAFQRGYHFTISCPSGKYEINIGKNGSICFKTKMLVQLENGKREYCDVELC